MTSLTVTHADMRALGYCNRGGRAWFARHGLDWSRFLEAGVPARTLLATGDVMAQAVVAQAQTRRDEEQDGR
ncbi:hypothetical protein [Hahella sp. HN01]|uniref:hypothetical protein n=1 Tax=Hahella sp. HN01 TaxID=2847262 RepID=UPI001C1EB8F2|nr:hypothetical protein [Hahella sp. HN01]MBU6956023.1 hypothetical protein [Hahella sp. HN01]